MVSATGIYYILKRNGLNRLPRNATKRIHQVHRYEKQVPGHHIQVDVKLLNFSRPDGSRIRRFQYTAIDEATRIRVLKIYNKQTQQNAIAFIDHVISKVPFRINEVRTDNGHEFHSTDDMEFYQLLTYTDDVDLYARLDEWEKYYNMSRPYGGLRGKTPFDVLRAKLRSNTVSAEVQAITEVA